MVVFRYLEGCIIERVNEHITTRTLEAFAVDAQPTNTERISLLPFSSFRALSERLWTAL